MKLNILNLVRHPPTELKFSPVYNAQKRTWNEVHSLLAADAKKSRITSWVCIGLAAFAIVGLVYDDSLSKFIPYVVERDHLGDEIAIGPTTRAPDCDPVNIRGELQKWLYDVRTVGADMESQRHNIFEAYHHTNATAAAKGELDEWFSNNIPWERAKDTIVTITVTNMIPADPASWKTWRGNWTEETRSRDGTLERSEPKEVSINVSCHPPTTRTEINDNPSGVFVDAINWKN